MGFVLLIRRGDNCGHFFCWNRQFGPGRTDKAQRVHALDGQPIRSCSWRYVVCKEGHIELLLHTCAGVHIDIWRCDAMQAVTSRTPPRQRIFRPDLTRQVAFTAQCVTTGYSVHAPRSNAYKLEGGSTCVRGSASRCRALPVALPPAEATAILVFTSIMGLMATLPGLLMIHGGFARAGCLCPFYNVLLQL